MCSACECVLVTSFVRVQGGILWGVQIVKQYIRVRYGVGVELV